MDEAPSTIAPGGRLARLLAMLESDPRNLPLLGEAAEAALAERHPQSAQALLQRYAEISILPPRELNLSGLAALQLGEFAAAAACFESLLDSGEEDGALRFNLAWTRAMQKDFDGALALLSDELADALPQAGMLQVQLLHQLGEFDLGAARARRLVELHPEHAGLMAAVSVLAMDVEDAELAAYCAARAPGHPDALATLGTLALGEERPEDALDMFNRALERNGAVPRAWVGRGLAELLAGRSERAAADIDRGAEMFGSHLGSWIAAGWAHFVSGDLSASRARFETALRLDSAFAESHGSLAVVDLLEGNAASARRRAEIAFRLDKQCFSAALARTLLAAGEGNGDNARRIFELALNTPVDPSGRTIAQSMAKLAMARG
ncbi:MAG TPA: tetratricopeptide repeat protein [Allosphingosinicella sp.]|jgi:tetratricopeptide (TPR) repeat protein